MVDWWGSGPEMPALWWAACYLAFLLVFASLAGPGWRWVSAGYHFHQSKRRQEQDGNGNGGVSSDKALTKSLRARNRELLDGGNTLHRDHVALLARHKLEGEKWAAEREAAQEENRKLRIVLDENLQEVERLRARSARVHTDETESDGRHCQHIAPYRQTFKQDEHEKQREALEKKLRELEVQLEGTKAQSARAAAMEAELQRKDTEMASIRKQSAAFEARNRVLAMAVAMRKKEMTAAGATAGAAAAEAPAGAVGVDPLQLEEYTRLMEEELEKLRRAHAEHVKHSTEAAPGLATAKERLWKMQCEQLTKERGALQAQVQELQKQIGLVTADGQATKESEAMQWAIEKAALERKNQEAKTRNLEAMQELGDKGRCERATLEKIERLNAQALANTKAKKLWDWERMKFERQLKEAATALEEARCGDSTAAQVLADEKDAIREQWEEDKAEWDKKRNELKVAQEQLTDLQAQLKGALVAHKTLTDEKDAIHKQWAVERAGLNMKQDELKCVQEKLEAATQKQLQDIVAKAALDAQLEETEAMGKREKDAHRQELEKARAATQAKAEECVGLSQAAERLRQELVEMQSMVQTKGGQAPGEWHKEKLALEDTVQQMHLQLENLMQERQAVATMQKRWEEEKVQLLRKVGETTAASEGARRVHLADKEQTIKAWSQKQATWRENHTALLHRLGALEQKNSTLQFEAQRLKEEKARWAGDVLHFQKVKSDAKGCFEEVKRLQGENTKLQAERDDALVKKKALVAGNAKLTQELEKATSAIKSWFEEAKRLEGEKTKVQAERDDALAKSKVLGDEKDAIRKQWAEDKAESDKRRDEFKVAQEQLTKKQAQLRDALVAHKTLTDEKDAIHKQWAVERAELNMKQDELKCVQEKLEAATQKQLQDTIAKAALEAQLEETEAMGKREKDAHRRELEEARAVTHAKTQECAGLSQEAERLRRELGEMQAAVQTKGEQWSVLDKLNRQLAAEVGELKAALGKHEAISSASEAISIEQVRAELRAIKAEAEAKQRETYHELAGAKSTIRVLEGDKAALEVLRRKYEARDRSLLALKDELVATQKENTDLKRKIVALEERLAAAEANEDIATKEELEEMMKSLEKAKKEKTTLEQVSQGFMQTLEAQKRQDAETAARALEQAIKDTERAAAEVRSKVMSESEERIKELERTCAGIETLEYKNTKLEHRLHLLRRRKQLLAEDRERVLACAAELLDGLQHALHAAGGEWSDAQEETAGAQVTAAVISKLAREYI